MEVPKRCFIFGVLLTKTLLIMEEQMEILAQVQGNQVIVLNKKAKYQLGIITILNNTYFVANDEKPYKHLNNAIDSLIEQAYIS